MKNAYRLMEFDGGFGGVLYAQLLRVGVVFFCLRRKYVSLIRRCYQPTKETSCVLRSVLAINSCI